MSQTATLKKEKELELLVEELVKANPSQAIIKDLTQKLGLEYSADIVDQMDIVLKATSHFIADLTQQKNKAGLNA